MWCQILRPEIEPLRGLALLVPDAESAYLQRLVLRTTEQGIQVCRIDDAEDITDVMMRIDREQSCQVSRRPNLACSAPDQDSRNGDGH
jgi:hypothetical protein